MRRGRGIPGNGYAGSLGAARAITLRTEKPLRAGAGAGAGAKALGLPKIGVFSGAEELLKPFTEAEVKQVLVEEREVALGIKPASEQGANKGEAEGVKRVSQEVEEVKEVKEEEDAGLDCCWTL